MAASNEAKYTGEFIVSEAPGGRSRENVTVLSGQVLEAGEVVGRVDKGIGGLAIPTVVGTGNGTMTGLTAGPAVQEGAYVLTCITEAANGGVFSVTAPDGTALPNATVGTPYVSDHLSFTLNDGSTDFDAGDVFTVTVAAGTSAAVVGTGNGTVTSVSPGPDAVPGLYTVTVTGAVTNGGVVEVNGPNGVVKADSITAGAGGTLVVATRQINLTVTDGSTDFAKGDLARIVVFNKLVAKVVEWDPTPAAWDGRQKAAGVLYAAVDATAGDTKGVLVVRDAEVNAGLLAYATGITAAEQAVAKAQLATRGIIAR